MESSKDDPKYGLRSPLSAPIEPKQITTPVTNSNSVNDSECPPLPPRKTNYDAPAITNPGKVFKTNPEHSQSSLNSTVLFKS